MREGGGRSAAAGLCLCGDVGQAKIVFDNEDLWALI